MDMIRIRPYTMSSDNTQFDVPVEYDLLLPPAIKNEPRAIAKWKDIKWFYENFPTRRGWNIIHLDDTDPTAPFITTTTTLGVQKTADDGSDIKAAALADYAAAKKLVDAAIVPPFLLVTNTKFNGTSWEDIV